MTIIGELIFHFHVRGKTFENCKHVICSKGRWLMMVQQSGESLGGWCVNHPCTYPLGCSLPTSTGVVWPDSTEVRGTSSQLRPIRELGMLRWPWPFQQNLREKIHAFCRQREEDSDPGNHEIFRFRLRLSVFRGQTFVDGPFFLNIFPLMN